MLKIHLPALKNSKLIIVILISSLLFLKCGEKRPIRRVEWKKLGIEEIPKAAEYPDYEAVVLLNKGILTIESGNSLYKALFEKHKIIKIFTKKGFKYGNIIIPHSKNDNIENIQARTISPEGQITELKQENIFRLEQYPGTAFYSAQNAVKFALPALSEGCIIDYSYQVYKDIRNYISRWDFQERIPTEHSYIRLAIPGEWELKYRQNNIDLKPEIDQAPAGFKSVYEWELFDIEALEIDEFMPAYRNVVKSVEFAPPGIKKWEDIVDWYSDVFEKSQTGGDEIREFTQELVNNLNSNYDKMEKIYNWVSSNIRYVTIEIDEGNIRPEKAEKVFEYRYGDCKDMTALMHKMAEATDIEIYPVLISTSYNGKIDTSFATPNNFVHAIAYCPEIGQGIWLDPTAKNYPFGEIPHYLQGLNGLIISQKLEKNFQKLPSTSHQDNQATYNLDLTFPEDNKILILGKTLLTGNKAAEFRRNYMDLDSSRIHKILQKYYVKKYFRSNLENYNIKNLEPSRSPLELDFKLIKNVRDSINSNIILQPLNLIDFNYQDNFILSDRRHPIKFDYPYKKSLKLNINLPRNYNIFPAQAADSLITPISRYFYRCRGSNNNYTINLEFEIKQNLINRANYKGFKKFIADCIELTPEIIIKEKQ